jgi:endonuclease/exonuclease/phosphatase family metal-dependent hydrolase
LATRWVVLPVAIVACGLTLSWRGGRDSVERIAPAALVAEVGSVEFTVATYNVQGRPVLDGTRRKFPLISPLLNRFDLVGLQECFQHHELLWEQATHATKLHHGRLKAPWKPVGSGLSTLARFPMLDMRAEFFHSTAELQNRLASKGMLLVRLDVGGRVLDLYNAHLDAGSSPEAQHSRRAQAAQLASFVRAHSPPQHSVIVVGDFNMSPSRPGKPWTGFDPLRYHSAADALARTRTFDGMLRDLGFRDAADELHGPRLDDVDRVLYRAGTGQTLEPLEWSRVAGRFVDDGGNSLSDHLPIAVRMRLATAAASGDSPSGERLSPPRRPRSAEGR